MMPIRTPASSRLGLPRVARRHGSELDRVQCPSFMSADFGSGKRSRVETFAFIQSKAQVLYSNPQASITARPSLIVGHVAHMNRMQSAAAVAPTGRALIS